VIVATDDRRICEAVRGFGGEARMTDADHRSGTDRIAEVARSLRTPIVVNVQGDEPQIHPEQITQVIGLLEGDAEAVMGTLAHEVASEQEWKDPDAVKVVTDSRGYALYFSRSPIPHVRGSTDWMREAPLPALKHLGIYSYRREFLLRYPSLPPAPLEEAEKLEQLRALWHGYRIKVGTTPHRCIGIDTPEDLERWLALYRQR
ncbi:MAG: 3-deoxy-manno-octulosonate cytidylyltransferase, partial [Candidatus Brocadiae bacterium]|nr:3-deoxy-manno-octulosonate cytidylyltransferase [Candidatus Brocadiia bacterium]